MKRSDEKVALRIDYSNQPNYWNTIVDSPGEKRKRSLHPRDLAQRESEKRFFSENEVAWDRKLDRVHEGEFYTDFSQSAREDIINSQLSRCDNEYLELTSSGTCIAHAKFGFTMIGTLQPFSLDQTYGFIDLWYDLDAYVKITGDVGVDTEFKRRPAHKTPTTTQGFSHPGIVSFTLAFNIDIALSADNASFSG